MRDKRRIANETSFAILNVGVAVSACKRQLNLDLHFVVLGESHDPSHTGIYGYAGHNAKTATILAKSVRPDEVYPVKNTG